MKDDEGNSMQQLSSLARFCFEQVSGMESEAFPWIRARSICHLITILRKNTMHINQKKIFKEFI